MRALRVVGLEEDGETVVCEDPDNGERFTVPADERLRAAARGDLTRLGQVQIEMESQIRPREIQARVRAGASVEEIAAECGLPEQRVERYAHPVLLERAQVAERAQRAHPVREDGPDVQTLGEVVAHTFGMRGHDYGETSWDSWRGDDGKWIVSLYWQAGRTENSAHWTFNPGAQGGTIAPLDDDAADLLDPSPSRPLRTVRPVTELAREALELDHSESEEDAAQQSDPDHGTPAPVLGKAPAAGMRGGEGVDGPGVGTPHVPPMATGPLVGATIQSADAGHLRDADQDGAAGTEQASRTTPDAEEQEEFSDDEEDESETSQGRKDHPIVPSWEDVLLGVRSNR
ncbi:septation protein SepH [Actinopolyspora halophila]|uniref:septation protein SepH n=1 Tax=Actinopolyspora halophila TaxID=1850 RepID=UPI000380BF4E|nr:septation protein SepH [Actinopolyspora halophila]